VGTFYRNFPDRRALCEELVHAHFEKTVDRIEALSRNAGLGDRKRISSAVMEYLSFRERDGDLIAECGDGTYQGKPFYQTDTFERLMASFVRILSPLLKGRSEEEIRFRSEMLAAMMRSDIYAYERMVRKLSNREIVNRLIAVIVPGAGGATGSL
jgi:AcrR family transcriptional regulator